MNCVGRSGTTEVRFPALGELSGDWGGGLMIGTAAVGAACRVEDGRGPATRLATVVPAALGFGSPRALLLALHTGALDRGAVASLAPVVLDLADAGDAVCIRLVERQADEVLALVAAAARRLGAEDGSLPVILDGSLLKAGCRRLDERIRAGIGAHAVVTPPEPPVHGAVLLARDALAPSTV